MAEYEQDPKRLRCALGIIIKNLEGEGFDSLKPISVQFANELAAFGRRAFFGEPDERLDKAMENFEQ